MAAGLAGGSTDAAAVLKGINELFNLDLDIEKLAEIGVRIGADVPFCIKGGTMLSEGIGEVLTPLPPIQGIHLIVACPRISVSNNGFTNI
jgi:4-diphosphocytidyl-2-C-methyl-D-erythritol kinase